MGEETDIAEPLSAEHVVAAEDITANEPSKERHRKRKKLLYQSIRELMEFYLGDTNLSKDRFVSQKIKGEPFVYMDLSVFLTFNKMRQLTSSLEDVAKALSTSDILQVSKDGTQVCRKTPILKKENEEECTIYVEQLGPDMDHKLLTRLFSQFGPVDYVSMPRFSHNNKFKGFAFVEFKDPECAKKALETLNEKGCCLSPHMAPEELMSIKNFDPNKENKTGDNSKVDKSVEKKEDKGNFIESTDSGDITNASEESQSTKAEDCVNRVKDVGRGKKKRKCSEEADSSCNKKLKSSLECNDSESGKDSKISEENVTSKKKRKRESSMNSHIENEGACKIDTSGETSHKKNKNKRSKLNRPDQEIKEKEQQNKVPENEGQSKGKKKNRKHSGDNDNPDECDSHKCENDANEPARTKPKSETEDATETAASQAEGEGEPMEEDAVIQKKKRKKRKKVKKDKPSVFSLGLKVLPKREWRQLRNKYLNMQRESMRTLKQHLSHCHKPEERESRKDEPLTFTPGTIVKVVLDEPVTNAKAAKSDMRVDGEIRYVDLEEGSPCVYLRTSTADLATSLVQAKHWPNMEVIQGQEEAEYYDKIKADREHYFNKNKPIQRGRSKLLKRAERFQGKHMTTFDTPQNL